MTKKLLPLCVLLSHLVSFLAAVFFYFIELPPLRPHHQNIDSCLFYGSFQHKLTIVRTQAQQWNILIRDCVAWFFIQGVLFLICCCTAYVLCCMEHEVYQRKVCESEIETDFKRELKSTSMQRTKQIPYGISCYVLSVAFQ